MMGIESHGMILSAVDDEGNLRLASVGEGVADGERTILSGIAQYYPDPAALVGKQIIAITNLAPRKMMGIESHGMILSAVDDEGNLRLASVGEGVADGALIG